MPSNMSLADRASYLSSLTFLIDFHTKLGGPAAKSVIAEFNYHNDLFLKEVQDEARKREQQPDRSDENRTDFSSGIPRGSVANRESRGTGESSGAALRRPGIEGSDGK